MENKQELDIQKIKDVIKYSQENIKPGEDSDHIVIFWGYTGVGKSATILLLSGETMYGYIKNSQTILTNVESRDIANQKMIDHKLGGKAKVVIGQSIQSLTVYPDSLPMQPIGERKQKITLWDSAGFGDNQGITQIIINTYLFNRLFSLKQKVKLVFTINFDDIKTSQKGNSFKKIAATLTTALKHFQNYQQSMALLVTKTNNLANEQQLRQLLIKNAALFDQTDNPLMKNFLKNLESGKIRIMHIRSPQIGSNATGQNPQNVTYFYQNFKKQFYDTILSLKHAKLPHFQATGLKPEQIKKCLQLASQTKKQLQAQTNQLFKKLQDYFSNEYGSINFSTNLQRNKFYIDLMQNLIDFRQNLIKKLSITSNSKDQLKKNFEELTKLFQNKQVRFECVKQNEKSVCKPMSQINNSLIIINFIMAIQLPEQNLDQYKQERLLKQFFQTLKKLYQEQLALKIHDYEKRAREKLQNFITQGFKDSVQDIKLSDTYKNWKKDVKVIPGIYLNLSKFNNDSQLLLYLRQMNRIEQSYQMECRSSFQNLYSELQYNQEYSILQLNQKQIIQKNLKPHFANKLTELQNKQFVFLKWDQKQFPNQDNIQQKIKQAKQKDKSLQQELNKYSNKKSKIYPES